MLAETVKAYMERFAMAAPGSRLLVACSGGADSMALLHLLSHMGEYQVACAHFNHQLRGAEADRDEAFVRAYCGEVGLPFHCGSADVAAWARAHGLGTEAAARELRYAFLERCAEETNCSRIATAHNADDNAETVLLRLLRGTGTRGLGGIPPRRGNIIRPLLCASRAEIQAYLDAFGLSHVEDSSNAEDIYTRNRLRRHVLPLLRELNPAAVDHINAAAELLREDETYLEGQAEAFLAANRLPDGGLSIPALLAAPLPVAMRVLRRCCPGAGRGQLRAVYQMCHAEKDKKPRQRLSLPNCCAVRDRERLSFLFGETPPLADAPGTCPPVALTEDAPALFPEVGKLVRRDMVKFTKEIHSSFNTFYFNYDNICGRIDVGFRQPGDHIRLAGRNCGKSLKKLFTEAKLSIADRNRRIVLRDTDGVLAVEGFGIAERCVPVPGQAAVRVEILDIPPS